MSPILRLISLGNFGGQWRRGITRMGVTRRLSAYGPPGARQTILAVASLTLILTGCASRTVHLYDGAARPSNEVAILETPTATLNVCGFSAFYRGFESRVRQIGGADINSRSVAILPGEHKALVEVRRAVPFAPSIVEGKPIEFFAEAGHRYAIGATRTIDDAENEEIWVWVYESTTGKTVSGDLPSDVRIFVSHERERPGSPTFSVVFHLYDPERFCWIKRPEDWQLLNPKASTQSGPLTLLVVGIGALRSSDIGWLKRG